MYIRCVLDLNKKRPLDAGAPRTDNKKLKLAGNVIHSYMCYIYIYIYIAYIICYLLVCQVLPEALFTFTIAISTKSKWNSDVAKMF